MSEEAVQEMSEEVTSDVVDTGVEETSVSNDVQVEDSSPELDLTDVFSESTPEQTDDFRSRVEQAGVRFEDDTQPREALFNAYTQAQEYNQQWQQYHQQQEAQQQQQEQQMMEMMKSAAMAKAVDNYTQPGSPYGPQFSGNSEDGAAGSIPNTVPDFGAAAEGLPSGPVGGAEG